VSCLQVADSSVESTGEGQIVMMKAKSKMERLGKAQLEGHPTPTQEGRWEIEKDSNTNNNNQKPKNLKICFEV
jgi:hypothetical protein